MALLFFFSKKVKILLTLKRAELTKELSENLLQ